MEILLTNIPAMVTMPVQKETNARMIMTVTKNRDVNATDGTKRLGEAGILLDQLLKLVQEKRPRRTWRPSIAARWEEKKGKLNRRVWESESLMELIRFVRLSSLRNSGKS